MYIQIKLMLNSRRLMLGQHFMSVQFGLVWFGFGPFIGRAYQTFQILGQFRERRFRPRISFGSRAETPEACINLMRFFCLCQWLDFWFGYSANISFAFKCWPKWH